MSRRWLSLPPRTVLRDFMDWSTTRKEPPPNPDFSPLSPHPSCCSSGILIGGFIDFTEVEEFERMMNVNFIGMVRVIKALLPLIKLAQGSMTFLSPFPGHECRPLLPSLFSFLCSHCEYYQHSRRHGRPNYGRLRLLKICV